MALPKADDVVTLKYSLFGQPAAFLRAKPSIDTSGLGYTLYGQPFHGADAGSAPVEKAISASVAVSASSAETYLPPPVDKAISATVAVTGAASHGDVIPPPPSMPADADGMWDVSELSSLFSNTGGTTPASVDGTVRRINDLSGNGNDLSNSSGWILRRDGDLYWLEMSDASSFAGVSGKARWNQLATSTEYELMLAARVEDIDTDNRVSGVMDNDGLFAAYSYAGMYFASSGYVLATNYDGDLDVAETAYTPGTDAVFNQRLRSSDLSIRVGSGAWVDQESGATIDLSYAFRIGAGRGVVEGVGQQVGGRFYGGFVRKTALSDAERGRALTYLNGLMGIFASTEIVAAASVAANAAIARAMSKSFSASSAITALRARELGQAAQASSAVTATRTHTLAVIRSLTASAVTVGADLARSYGRRVQASVTLSSTVASLRTLTRSASATVVTTGAALRTVPQRALATVTATGAALRQLGIAAQASVAATATAARDLARRIAASVAATASATMLVAVNQAATATSAVTASARGTLNRLAEASVAVTATQARVLSRHLQVAITTTASKIGVTSKALAASVSTSASALVGTIRRRAMSASATITATMAFIPKILAVATVTASASMARRYALVRTATVAAAGRIQRTISLHRAAIVSAIGRRITRSIGLGLEAGSAVTGRLAIALPKAVAATVTLAASLTATFIDAPTVITNLIGRIRIGSALGGQAAMRAATRGIMSARNALGGRRGVKSDDD